ncbi:hypothetical protein K469DRAFT_745424 [Zopfia rhizophila CBS 207.26]|uniref:C2H2-type domain-containing protein n=1 Tax=Zopfia rhizophila CBS 207.26 TaxID=1314779 RepID=A0A6A6EQF9_9PEZI|nr:hypothetical protein K469DRAFT_745424 [Zopfia rhizophila CBS 207.26]
MPSLLPFVASISYSSCACSCPVQLLPSYSLTAYLSASDAMSGTVSNVLAIRSRQTNRYPHSRSSIGPRIGIVRGRDCWWEAVGPALQDFKDFVPEIKTQLDGYCETVESGWITFSIYMIGKSEDNASPTIMFFSQQPGPRKDAMNALKKSGALKRYPGFKTGNMAVPPDVDNLIRPATDGQTMQQSLADGAPRVVFYDPSKPICTFGMGIFIQYEDGSMRAATAIAVHDGKNVFYQTVSHAFMKNEPHAKANVDDCYSDYEIASDTDDGFGEEGGVDITSRGSISSHEDSSDDLSERISASSGVASRTHELSVEQQVDSEQREDKDEFLVSERMPDHISTLNPIPKFNLVEPSSLLHTLMILGSLLVSSIDRDWALISITDETVLAHLSLPKVHPDILIPKCVASGPREAHVATYTASERYLTGTLSETPLYTKLPNSMSFQEVYKIRFDSDQNLRNGDCGSGVVDTETGELYGHIVAGSTGTGIAYIMAAHHVFNEMKEMMSRPWILPCQITSGWTTEVEVRSLTADAPKGYLIPMTQFSRSQSVLQGTFLDRIPNPEIAAATCEPHSQGLSSRSHDDKENELVTTITALKCLICDKAFHGQYASRNLDRHTQSKHLTPGTVKQTFPCEACDNTYQRRDALLHHQRRHHPELEIPSPIPRKRDL